MSEDRVTVRLVNGDEITTAGEMATSRVEWRVTGDPGPGYPPYAFTFETETQAQGFVSLHRSTGTPWADGLHIERRRVTETPWQRVTDWTPTGTDRHPVRTDAPTPRDRDDHEH